jgi:hypothetical protein
MTDFCRVRATHHTPCSQQTTFISSFTMLVRFTHPTLVFICHVERPSVKFCRSVRLSCSPLNGVETSLTTNRCFDSVYCELRTLFVSCEGSARVAQHDKLCQDVMNHESVSSRVYFCNSLSMQNTLRLLDYSIFDLMR